MKRNIAALGGDPDDVTIWEQAAGSMSVNLLMAFPPRVGDRYQRGVGHCGAFVVLPAATGSSMGRCSSGQKSGAHGRPRNVALQQLTSERLMKDGLAGTTLPMVDGYVLVEEALATFKKD